MGIQTPQLLEDLVLPALGGGPSASTGTTRGMSLDTPGEQEPASSYQSRKGGVIQAMPSQQGKTAPPLLAPEVRNAGPFPSRALRLDPKSRREVATWTSPPGRSQGVRKSHVWMGTFWFKAVGNRVRHLRGHHGVLEGLALPVPRSHQGALEGLILPVPVGLVIW